MKKKENNVKESINDYELIYLFTQGEEEALTLLIQRYKRITFFYINRYFALFPKYLDKHEMYQISLVSLYNAILTFNEKKENTFSTYFCVVLEHDLLMYIRHMRKNSNLCNFNALSLDQAINESEGLYYMDTMVNKREEYDPVKYASQKEMHKEIEKQLLFFEEKERVVFHLWMEGYTYREISESTSLDKKKIEYIIHKVKGQLKVSLSEWMRD